ncbi:polysaccharide biosynthesis C-terminal domain-containing protein [Candidatus Daviesbacteria bacterium]|nr:polysaccharide biosynthesis C-terminal domain-containing protein [Candidatus Daviesbacteria bacterium]
MEQIIKVSKQTVWQVLGKIVTSFSTIIILGIVSRRFGEDGTGVFTLALTYLAFFTLAIDFGVNAYLMPDLLKENFTLVWRKLFGFRLGLVVLLIPLAILGGLFWPTSESLFKQLILIGSVMAIIEPAIYVSANAIFQSRFRYDLSIIGWSVAALVTLFLVYSSSQMNLGLPWIMVDYSLGWLVGCFILLLFVKKFVKNIWPIFDFNFVKNLIKNAWPISTTLILNVVYFRLDAFILSFYRSFAEVGIYNLSYSIFQAALVLPTFIMNGYYPLMLRHLLENKQKFISNLKIAIFIMSILGFGGTLITVISANWVVSLIAGGKGFVGSPEALRILSLSFPAFFASSVLMWALVSLKKYRSLLVIYLIGLIFNTVLNLFFIPIFSYQAAAWITGLSEYLILIMQVVILYKHLRG